MNKNKLMITFLLVFVLSACNLPSGVSTQPPAQSETPTLAFPAATEIPSSTPLPTETPLPTLTPTPTIPIAWPLDKGVNCRYGPGTEWVTVGALLVGETATIQGKNADASWWYVVTAGNPGSPCWVAASVTLTAGNLLNLAVIAAPLAKVTDVTIKLEPKTIILPGCLGPVQPIKLEGAISVNGPTKVKWYFETQEDGPMSTETINFNGADTRKVEASFTPSPGAGSFWVRLVVTEPNSQTAETKYKIECP